MPSKNPVTILAGEDSFLVGRELGRIRRETLGENHSGLDDDRFSVGEHSLETVLDACALFPMLSPQRLVVLSGAEHLSTDAMAPLLKYFANPNPSTHFVLMASKIDGRLKGWQQAKKQGWIIDLAPPNQRKLPQWIAEESKRRGITLEPQALQALAEAIGANPAALASALETLETYVAPQKKITAGDVEKLIGGFFGKSVFELTDSVGRKNLARAMVLLDDLQQKGEPLQRILFMIVRHFRLLLLAREGISLKWSEQEVASRLGVHPFFVKDYLSQGMLFDEASLRNIYSSLLDTDRAAKQSPLSVRLIVDRFLMQTCLG